MLQHFRENLGAVLYRRILSQRRGTVQAANLQSSHSVGIIFDDLTQEGYETIKKYITYLLEHKVKATAICFVKDNQTPPYLLFRPGIDIVTFRDLSWIYTPRALFIKKFVASRFDILLDLSSELIVPLKYIVNLSKAQFKVGNNINNYRYFDMIIEKKPETSLIDYIEQIKHYLNTIKV